MSRAFSLVLLGIAAIFIDSDRDGNTKNRAFLKCSVFSFFFSANPSILSCMLLSYPLCFYQSLQLFRFVLFANGRKQAKNGIIQAQQENNQNTEKKENVR